MFVRPSLAEVTIYCAERAAAGLRQVDPQAWLDHYTANGWRVGRNAMKDWKAAVRTWEQGGYETRGKPASGKMDSRAIREFGKTMEAQK